MSAEFGTLTLHFSKSVDQTKQLQSFLEATLQHNSKAATLSADDESTPTELDTSTTIASLRKSLVTDMTGPMVCPLPCRCRCHRAGMFSWAHCDDRYCQRDVTSRRKIWTFKYGNWLGLCNFSLTISASLRARSILPSDDGRIHLFLRQDLRSDYIQSRLGGLHPMDEYYGGRTILFVSQTTCTKESYEIRTAFDTRNISRADINPCG